MRLLNGRFRLDLTDELVLPRTKDGDIDIRGTTELVTGIVEGWVREHPEQCLGLKSNSEIRSNVESGLA